MSDQLDKKLISKITEVFENFEDGSANEGWQKLGMRYPKRTKRRTAIWWLSSAAALFLIFGVWALSTQHDEPAEKATKAKAAQKTRPSDTTATPQLAQEIPNGNSQEATTRLGTAAVLTTKTHSAKKSRIKAKSRLTVARRHQSIEATETKAEHDLAIVALTQNMGQTSPDSTHNSESLIASSGSQSQSAASDNVVVYPSEVISKEKLSELMGNQKPEKPEKERKHRIAFFAGSYFTYAQGSEASMNSGAGVSSELKIGRRLKLATGISLGQNSVKFNQSIPKEAALNLDKTISSMNNTQLESNDQQPITAAGFSRNTISSYNASLLGFDIPVNLKYALLQRKNSIYLITGLSSNVFIRESYTYNFNSRSIKDQENTDSFQSFNFARVLNLSMGFEYPFSNKTIISVEPFLKYPLSGLGSHDLRFRAAGMNLKFNFNR